MSSDSAEPLPPTGRTPGSDKPSTLVNSETAIRHIIFWKNGFSIGDGDLMRYDDPKNARILAEINSGRAPPITFNVDPGQPVELRVANRSEEDYIPSSRKGMITIISVPILSWVQPLIVCFT
ncbi:SEP-domain-containing protein [Pluteus cervinus]|uniref:SEP-domain-containing protein n=1 Tax=Pluteus cervinus TaxID=181527 RepID=A0ACD3ARN7_9AGAR|nr:SEP-domain-containing protein [Pluteus cervinus]